jgi:hypothetical protein
VFVRVVRFTDVDPEHVKSMLANIEQADGPPEGVDSSGIQILIDEDQGTAVVLQQFETREKMEEGARVLGAMDASETPGTRASVDACELKLELSA